MRLSRRLVDGLAQEVIVEVEIDEDGPLLDAAIVQLANRARARGRGTAFGGAIRVTVREVGTVGIASASGRT